MGKQFDETKLVVLSRKELSNGLTVEVYRYDNHEPSVRVLKGGFKMTNFRAADVPDITAAMTEAVRDLRVGA